MQPSRSLSRGSLERCALPRRASRVAPQTSRVPSRQQTQVHLTGRGIDHTGILHVSCVENSLLRFVKGWLLSDLRKAETDLLAAGRSVLKIGNAESVREALGVENRLVGYVYLLDQEGRVRFRAPGTPDLPARSPPQALPRTL